MKFKRNIILAAYVVAMGFLLGTSAVQAQTVILDGTSTTAIGIEGLEVDGLFYNVSFPATTATALYGPPPGTTFPFPGTIDASDAMVLVLIALNNSAAESVGTAAPGSRLFDLGWGVNDIETGVWATFGNFLIDDWIGPGDAALNGFDNTAVYADFTLAGPPADTVTIGGSVTGLEGSGLVLQNNGGDDLAVPQDGVGAFATPLTPGSTYNVTVATLPTSPAQTCTVQNGSGTVPSENVTNVVVSCGDLVTGNVIKVAAEGDTLPDGTLLKQIVLDGGVSINIFGKVAFGGRDGDSTIAVFTQDGPVAAEGSTLEDDTLVDDISSFGEVAINAGQSGDRVAFHGRTGKDKAVFTQAGPVVKEGDTLPDQTLVDTIKDSGKVAINSFDLVAFHGKIKIKVGDGIGDRETFNAVFTSLEMVVVEGAELPDQKIVEAIDETGGVAINDFGDVAFHGDVPAPDTGADSLKAVFTSNGLVAWREAPLPGGTILTDIRERGGVAINIFGEVAFHGDVIAPDAVGAADRAVLIQDGLGGGWLVVKEGDTLPDGTVLEEINEIGGVAINFFGEVVFHGRTGGKKAVFTQDGLVAKEGDTLTDGSILAEIHPSGGVAINDSGDVAYHGKVGDNDAVFLGKAPVVVPATDGD